MKTMNKTERKSRTYLNAGKKVLIVLFSLGLAYGASAQRGGGHFSGGHGGFYGGGRTVIVSRPAIGLGFGLGWGL